MTNTERGLTKGLIMRCLIYHVAPNRFQAMCLELDVEVVAGSKVAAFRELVRVLCARARDAIATSASLPFQHAKRAPAEYFRAFNKAKEAPIGWGGHHGWNIHIADDELLPPEIKKAHGVRPEAVKLFAKLAKSKEKAPPKVAKKTTKKAAKKTTRKQKADAP